MQTYIGDLEGAQERVHINERQFRSMNVCSDHGIISINPLDEHGQVWLQRAGDTMRASPWLGGFAASFAFFRIPRDLLKYQPM